MGKISGGAVHRGIWRTDHYPNCTGNVWQCNRRCRRLWPDGWAWIAAWIGGICVVDSADGKSLPAPEFSCPDRRWNRRQHRREVIRKSNSYRTERRISRSFFSLQSVVVVSFIPNE